MSSFVTDDIKYNGDYLKLLSAVSRLSGLFSDSLTPYINYRVAENIFCRCFNAKNLSRADTAFDAKFNSVGVGLKTFICTSKASIEKIAEFNQLSNHLKILKNIDLAVKLSEFRNERIESAIRTYNLSSTLYHIVARRKNELVIFETDYKKVDIENICDIKESDSSMQFNDKLCSYSYNYSKSTLYQKFIVPENAYSLPIEIVEDPYSLLLEFLNSTRSLDLARDRLVKGINYVILPLYGIKDKNKYVFEKSGLNQWNAGGRKRDYGEVYIPIPIEIHHMYPSFFPMRDEEFSLQIPAGDIFRAKVCQDNSKALMTNPNNALSNWLLRTLFALKEGELATIERMNELGFDSVIITKTKDGLYKIDKTISESFEAFIE